MSALTDDDLTRLLSEAAGAFRVPDSAPVVAAAAAVPRVPLKHRAGLRWAVAAAVVAVLTTMVASVGVGVGVGSGGDAERALTSSNRGGLDRANAGSAGGSGSGSAGAGSTSGGFPSVSRQDSAVSGGGGDGSTSGGGFASGPSAGATDQLGSTRSGESAPRRPATGGVAAPSPDQGRVVKTGQVALEVAEGRVTATLTAVQQVATRQGGLVFGSTTQESGPQPTGTVTLRVPGSAFEATLVAVRGLDAEVVTASSRASDVTAQYADVQTQIRTLKATRERYLVILGRADTVGEILSVQQRVDGVSGQVDRLEGRLRVLSAQSEKSTLVVTVTEKGDTPVASRQAEERDGLGQAWDDAVDGFTSGVEAIVRNSGRTLLVAGCLLVLGFVGMRLLRLVRRRLV